MKKFFVICSLFILASCKSITYEDVNPTIAPNNTLLPAMEALIDTSNLEYTYSMGSYSGVSNGFGAGWGNNGWAGWTQTSTMSGSMFRDQRIGDVINLFEKEVKENITNPYGAKKGYIALKLGYRGEDSTYFFYSLFYGLTLCITNFFGFPFGNVTQSLEVNIEILDKNKELIKKYSENVVDKEWLAMYWGYGGSIYRKVAADNIKTALEKIRKRIEIDANEINKKLR